MQKLAIHGGEPVRKKAFPKVRNIGEEEKRAAIEVLDSDLLSGFMGTWSPSFYGGPKVQELEKNWSAFFNVKHSVSVNSASSGLYAAIAAAGVGPGDEVIVSPYSMIVSATCALMPGGIPIFADIDADDFCLSPKSIREKITPRTRAIVVVQLFGNTAKMDEIMQIAKEHNLIVIEDAAQAPAGEYRGRKTGTIGHMGVYSLNVHKTISTGEGGVVVTNDDALAERLQLIRNHGEVVVRNKGTKDICNIVGQNYRLCEIEAAMAIEQLKKLEKLTAPRIEAADYLTSKLQGFSGVLTPFVDPKVRHVYYQYAIRYDAEKAGLSRHEFARAINAEGIPFMEGYVYPIYLEPMFQKQIAWGGDGFPFNLYNGGKSRPRYEKGMCPVVEKMHEKELVFTGVCRAGVTKEDLDDVVRALDKVLSNTKY